MAKFVTEIRWRDGFRGTTDAADAYGAIEKLRKANRGQVEPEALVEAAKPKRHPLHPEFIWDDKLAAQVQRVEKARLILRSIVIVDKCDAKQPRRVYELNITPATNGEPARKVYKTMEDVMADPLSRRELLDRALGELRSFRKRYAQLKELSTLMGVIDEALDGKAA